MKEVFGNYSKYYDLFYKQKDYKKEVQYIEQLLLSDGKKRGSLLDLGCGTGGHALLLAQKGWDVTGIDVSESMLIQARQKARKAKLNIQFQHSDIRSFQLSKQFNAAIAMFAVVGYLTTNKGLNSFLSSVRRHLGQNALFIFDTWFGPAVLHQRPSQRFSILRDGNEKIVRLVTPQLNVIEQTVDVHYTIISLQKNKVKEEVNEVHSMRFFFVQEMELLLGKNGFRLEKVLPFGELSGIPDENCWNVTFVARSM
ncbi:MAG: class I SAM-dependent methyltransferase [Bacteroidota bacterium]